jgi:prepilin signal peptidase PulO-like enzyme (type II secretory pathway)
VLTLLTTFLLKKDSMGYGDIILIGVIGFWLGLFFTLVIILFASLFSISHWLFLKFIKENKTIILPFGSTLSLSTILVYIVDKTLQIDTSFLLT